MSNGITYDQGDTRVEGLAFGPDRLLYVGGQFSTAGGGVASIFARWSGEVLDNVTWLPLVLREKLVDATARID